MYEQRPDHCQAFECLLFQRVRSRQVSPARARRIIRSAKHLTAKVRRLLPLLGENNEALALAKRFRAVKKRLETQGADTEEASHFADLTLVMQKLQTILAGEFYPG